MKVLVTGGGGMLGHKLVQCWSRTFDVWTTVRSSFGNYEKLNFFNPRQTFDKVSIEDLDAIRKIIEQIKPDVIVNAVGIIKQLPSSGNVIQTLTVNSIFPHQLAELAREFNARLICVSTDCVFKGDKGNYTEEDIPDAIDLYGKSKNLGEVIAEQCLTIRTSIIGRELETAHSLLEWFLNVEEKSVKGFKNAVFSGFPTVVLAEIIAEVIAVHPSLSGLYHVASEPINKFDLLNLIKEFYRLDTEIEPVEDFKMDRSLDSMKFRKATGFQPKSWREMIEMMHADDLTSGIYPNKK